MQVISSGGIPLALALGVRGYRLRRPGWVIAGSAVAAWQLSIGFTLGLPFAYLLAARRGDRGDRLAAARPPAPRPRACARHRRRRGAVRRGRVRAQPSLPAGGGRAPGAPALAGHGGGLLRAAADLPRGARREPDLGRRDRAASRRPREHPGEDAVSGPRHPASSRSPGFRSSAYPRWLRRGLGAGVVAVSILALGFRAGGGLLWPYRIVYDVLPGWQAIRVPGRLVTLSSLGLALLAGAGAQRAMLGGAARRVSRSGRGGRDRGASACWPS